MELGGMQAEGTIDVVIHQIPAPVAAPLLPSYITVVEGQPKHYQCNLCGKQFKTKTHIRYHAFCQPGLEKPIKCSLCGKGFITKSHFYDHARSHTGIRPHSCDICGKAYSQKNKLKLHMESQHVNGKNPEQNRRSSVVKTQRPQKPSRCPIPDCTKEFLRPADLNRHLSRTHHFGKECPFSCNACGKKFPEQGILERHLKTHIGDKPFPCRLCSKAFLIEKDLNRHLLSHAKVYAYRCPICEQKKPFIRADNFLRHVRRQHAKSSEEAKQILQQVAEKFLQQTQSHPNYVKVPPSRLCSRITSNIIKNLMPRQPSQVVSNVFQLNSEEFSMEQADSSVPMEEEEEIPSSGGPCDTTSYSTSSAVLIEEAEKVEPVQNYENSTEKPADETVPAELAQETTKDPSPIFVTVVDFPTWCLMTSNPDLLPKSGGILILPNDLSAFQQGAFTPQPQENLSNEMVEVLPIQQIGAVDSDITKDPLAEDEVDKHKQHEEQSDGMDYQQDEDELEVHPASPEDEESRIKIKSTESLSSSFTYSPTTTAAYHCNYEEIHTQTQAIADTVFYVENGKDGDDDYIIAFQQEEDEDGQSFDGGVSPESISEICFHCSSSSPADDDSSEQPPSSPPCAFRVGDDDEVARALLMLSSSVTHHPTSA